MYTHLPPFLRSIGAPFHGYLTVPEDFEHIEPKSSGEERGR